MTPPLNREPRRIRPPFDVAVSEPVDDRQADETADQWRARRHADRVAALLEALDGIELGEHDVRIVEWLAGWDNGTVGTVASLIHRAREAGVPLPPYREVFDATAPLPGRYICGTCGVSVEARPCPEHSPMGGAL